MALPFPHEFCDFLKFPVTFPSFTPESAELIMGSATVNAIGFAPSLHCRVMPDDMAGSTRKKHSEWLDLKKLLAGSY